MNVDKALISMPLPNELPSDGNNPRADLMERLKRHLAISQAFRPATPIDSVALFAGRKAQVHSVLNAIFQKGQHAMLYGERGVGKTSLANVLYEFLNGMGLPQIIVGTINCDTTIRFSDLWKKVFRETIVESRVGLADSPKMSPALKGLPDIITPEDVRFQFQGIGKPIIVILDEVDRISDITTRKLLADTIKTLSDHAVDVTLILVGVADCVDDLIAQHRSIERALVQVQLPRMSSQELFEIVDKGLERVSMSIEEDARFLIAGMSQGLPHYTHLLTMNAAQAANNADHTRVTTQDLNTAIKTTVENAQQSTVSAYLRAVSSPRENLYPQVLLACALAHSDDLGYFAAVDVKAPLAAILTKTCEVSVFSRHLHEFCLETRGSILQKTGQPRRFRFRFSNPLMEPFTILKGLANKMVNQEVLASCWREIAQFH